MNLLERLTSWLGLDTAQRSYQPDSTLQGIIDQSRAARRTEHYAEALRLLDEAVEMTRPANNVLVATVLDMQRAELLVTLEQYDEAETLLNHIERVSRSEGQQAQIAYALGVRGKLVNKRGQVEEARSYFERSLAMAKSIRALSAAGRAGGYLAEIYLQEGNAAYAEHLLRDALPRIDASGDVEIKSYFVGRMGEALIQLGQNNDGGRLLHHALKLAERLQHRPYMRIWRLALGRQAIDENRFDDAFHHYQHALSLFSDPPPHNAEYFDGLCGLSHAALKVHRVDMAITQAQKAVNLSHDTEHQKARSSGLLGMALRLNGQFADALPYLETAANIYEQANNFAQPALHIDVLRSLALARGELVGVEEAIATYQHAVEIAKRYDVNMLLARVYRDLGLYYRKLNRHTDALIIWPKALYLFEQENNYAQVARLYCDIGAARFTLGQGKRALKEYEQALMALNAVNDDYTRGLVLSNVANAFVEEGDIETTEGFFAEAIQIAQRLDDKASEAIRRGNYGWYLLVTGRLKRAQASLQHARRLSDKLGLALQSAIQNDNLALLHAAQEEYQEALKLHDISLARMQSLENVEWEHLIKLNKGDTLLAMRRFDEAAPLFTGALDYGRENNLLPIIVQALIGQSRIALQQDDLKSAQQAIEEAETIARNADFRRLLGYALVVRSELEYARQDAEQAETTWQEARDLLKQSHSLDFARHPQWTRQSA